MSYPQPDANAYCKNGYQFFRLNTLLASPGDIYESEQSGHALALGPESDIANVDVAYFDDQVDTFVNQTQLGPGRSWTGRIDARLDGTYTPSNRPGRIMLWPSNLYDPLFLPTGFTPNSDTLTFVQPRLDVIEYFAPPGSLDPVRNDKDFSFQELPIPVGSAWLIVPYWGRKYASVRFTNVTSGDTTFRLVGVNYYMNDTHKALEVQLDTATVATGTQRLFLVKAETHGMFDALMVEVTAVTPDGPTPLQVIVSDTP